jgi:hypothetical protein
MADTGARQNTNIFRVPPGGGALVKTGGMPITQAVMPLPYKEPSNALMNLVNSMAETGMRIGGTSEQQVGEGKTEMPVGTTLAMIEQATKVLNAVHKRLHAAQAEEFQLIAKCFKENPESFWKRNKTAQGRWNEQNFVKAVNDYDLIPQADPNTANFAQRIMKIMGLKQLQAANPSMYDPIAVDMAALQAMGWNNAQQFMVPPSAQGKPPPELLEKMAKAQTDKTNADARMLDSQTRAQESQFRMGLDADKHQLNQMKVTHDIDNYSKEVENEKQERLSQERIQLLDLAQNIVVHPESAGMVQPLIQPALEQLAQNDQQSGEQ